MAFWKKADSRAAKPKLINATFQKDVLHSVAFLDAIERRLSQDDGGVGVIRSLTMGKIITSSVMLAPEYMGHGASVWGDDASPLDFPIILMPQADKKFSFGLSYRQFITQRKPTPFLKLSILQESESMEGVLEALPRFRDGIAHEHKHFMDWNRTGDFGSESMLNPKSAKDLSIYVNDPMEVSAWIHAAAVNHFMHLRSECLTEPGRLEELTEMSFSDLMRPLVESLHPGFLSLLSTDNAKLSGNWFNGYIRDCLRPMLADMQVKHGQAVHVHLR